MNDEIHSLSGAYAIDAVDDIERARFEQHLAVCSDCAAEVAGLRGAAAQLSVLAIATPPERLRDQVMRDIQAVRPLPPQVAAEASARIDSSIEGRAPRPPADRSTPDRAHRLQHRFGPRLIAAAAAAVLLLGGLAAWHPWDRQSQGQVTVADRVLQAPDAQRTTKTLPGGASVMVVRSTSVGRAILMTKSMPGAPQGKVYQLWLQDPKGTFTSAGLMPDKPDQTVVLQGDAASAAGAGITIEPPGGSAKPTTEPIALFSFA